MEGLIPLNFKLIVTMTPEETLKQVKDKYAKEQGCNDWADFIFKNGNIANLHLMIDKLPELYHKAILAQDSETPQSKKLAITTTLQRVAREYFEMGRNTPRNVMAPAGDPLWGLKNVLEDKYKYLFDMFIK